ncbi:MAG: UDP binding domain-containing protein, partial [Nitrososphaeraceae archaeon]
VYRDVNIALANELAIFSERLGINFWEVRNAANSQPFCHIHKPGIGVGGACIPVYPQFILKTAKGLALDCKITRLGRLLNNSMPKYCVRQALRLVKPKKYKDLKITLLGLAFRGGVSDTRLSPTYDVMKELQKLKVKKIIVHDPLVKNDGLFSKHKNTLLVNDLDVALKGADLIIIMADHEEYKKLSNNSIGTSVLYDGRGIITEDKLTGVNHAMIGNIN